MTSPTTFPSADLHTVLGSNTVEDAELHVRQVNNKIAWMFENEFPFVAMTSSLAKLDTGRARKYDFEYVKDYKRTVQLDSAVANLADDTLELVSATGLETEDRMLINPETGEQMPIASISGNTVTVFRNQGIAPGKVAGAIANGTKLLIGSVARREGATDPMDPVGIIPTLDYNYHQQFEQVWAVTDVQKACDTYYGDPEAFEEKVGLRQYMRQKEIAGLFQYRNRAAAGSASSAGGSYGRQITGGAKDYVENFNGGTNILDANGAFTYQEFNSFMTDRSRACRIKDFTLITGTQVGSIMNLWPLSYHQADQIKHKKFGFKYKKFFGQNWTVSLVHSEAFDSVDENFHQGLIMNNDPEMLSMVSMAKLPDTKNAHVSGPKTTGSHLLKTQMTGMHTFKIQPFAHMWIKNANS